MLKCFISLNSLKETPLFTENINPYFLSGLVECIVSNLMQNLKINIIYRDMGQKY